MNERELTQNLRELIISPPPAEWRNEILTAAKKVAPFPAPKQETRRTQWLTRAAMVIVWIGITLSHFQGEQEDSRLATYLAPSHLPCPIPITGEDIEWLVAQLFSPKKERPQAAPHYHSNHSYSDPI